MGMNYGTMNEIEMLMNVMEMDEWTVPEMTADDYSDSWEKADW